MAGQATSAPRLATLRVSLDDLVGPPPKGVAPLEQFREALLLDDEADGLPPDAGTLQRTNAKLLQLCRYNDGGYHTRIIRRMVLHDGWAEADATVEEFSL